MIEIELAIEPNHQLLQEEVHASFADAKTTWVVEGILYVQGADGIEANRAAIEVIVVAHNPNQETALQEQQRLAAERMGAGAIAVNAADITTHRAAIEANGNAAATAGMPGLEAVVAQNSTLLDATVELLAQLMDAVGFTPTTE